MAKDTPNFVKEHPVLLLVTVIVVGLLVMYLSRFG